jgi:hypothetical protein
MNASSNFRCTSCGKPVRLVRVQTRGVLLPSEDAESPEPSLPPCKACGGMLVREGGAAEATCAWGQGPDVFVVVARANACGFPWLGTDPNVKSAGSFGLTIKEAIALATQLVQSAVAATRLDAGYVETGRPRSSPNAAGGSTCKQCAGPINRENLHAELARVDVPATAERAAKNSVFCSVHCALENFGGVSPMTAGQ